MNTGRHLATVAALALAPLAVGASEAPAPAAQTGGDLASICTPEAVQAIAPAGVTVKSIKNGAFKGATQLVPASGNVPAFCQVSGSFVTNPATGKTANFMATFPSTWNGKYMQLGCSGLCGQFFVSNPALPPVTVTAQGYPGQIIEKGYATFATDEGHEGMGPVAGWALKADGSPDRDAIEDLYYRADKVLARIGKQFSTAFYARAKGAPQKISRSYFNGCSGGGRDAMVVASYFPDEFDGIIAGSPYHMLGSTIQATAVAVAAKRPGGAVSPALLKLVDTTVKNQCDALDGVKDGLLQNPGACNFRATRDLPRCSKGAPAGQCFTDAQIETVSVMTTAVTDERGEVVQPAYSLSELNVNASALPAIVSPVLKIFVNDNDPAFDEAALFTFKQGGPGPVTDFRAVIPAAEVAKIRQALAPGTGHLPENTGRFMQSKAKLLIWHNLSDELLTPWLSARWYRQLAAKHGGYAKVQQKARLFMLPGTTHCSITGIVPNSFDSIGAMENWVEKGQAPNTLMANVADRQYSPGLPKGTNLRAPNATMPLCKFPEMARYSGKGDVKDGKNWSCPAGDTRLLTIGESGRQAGVVE